MAQVGDGDGEQISLNIMPMLDIFSILILFLLMSFSTEPVSYDVSQGVELPYSSTLISLDEVPALRVTQNKIMVNDKDIVGLSNGQLKKFDKFQGAIYPVFKELEILAAVNKKIQVDSNEPLDITLEVDKSHEFKLVKKVMKSAQQADFIKFNLMVEKDI